MTSRERFLATMDYGAADRVFFYDGLVAWPETIERWKTEGYDPAHPPDFGADCWAWYSHWFLPNPPFERKVIAEDDTTVTYVNHEGILIRERKDQPLSSMPQFVRFPVETREDFRRFYRERMRPDMAVRQGGDWVQHLEGLRDRDCPLIVISNRWGGFFGPLRNLTGLERLCMLFYDDPAFVEEMMDATADFIIAIMGQILDHTDIDAYSFWEDMAYKTGPLLGPDLARRYMLPRYRRVVDFVRSRGVKLIALDSDGDIRELIPVWLDAGINVLYPFECQAGMDVLDVRRQYGRDLRLWHGFDKRAIARGPGAIDAEIDRLRPLIAEGGYIPGPDHGLPPDVSFENACFYMERMAEVVARG